MPVHTSVILCASILSLLVHADTRLIMETAELVTEELPAGEMPVGAMTSELPVPAVIDEHMPSLSCGAANRGALFGGVELQLEGEGYIVQEPWLSRGNRYGTSDIIGLIGRAAATVSQEQPGSLLAVGDISAHDGGAIRFHHSHQSGRDVDLVYYALDPDGQPFPPDGTMPYYRHNGMADYARSGGRRAVDERYFDLARNWALVKALASDSEVEIRSIFVSWRVRSWLLDFAAASGEPQELIDRIKPLLRNQRAHNDHMHVRIGCSAHDVEAGLCRDRSARRARRYKHYAHISCPPQQ